MKMLMERKSQLVKDIEREARVYFVDAGPTHDWSHVERVRELSEIIGKSENAGMLVVRLAVLLHDVGRKLEDDTKGQVSHAEESERIAREILGKYNVDKSIIEQVCHCVKTHRFRNEYVPETIEAKVLFDADKLDSIGAIGVARSYSFSGEHKLRIYSEFKEVDIKTGYEKDHTIVGEFFGKLRKVKDSMLTKTGKKIANPRHRFMVKFFERLEKERLGEG